MEDGGYRSGNPNFSFCYIYTCDIDEALFRVKICSLDGILPPSSETTNRRRSTGGGDGGSPSSSPSSPSASLAPYKFATVQNHYEYNIVEDSNNFSFIDDLVSSGDDDVEENREETTSGIESSDGTKPPLAARSTFNQRPKELRKKQKKKKKMAEIIFGNLNQPFRALSCHPYVTCDLVSGGRRLCPPQQTQYKQMTNRYEWNEWLAFSLTLDTLPRDTMVCFTVWDSISPGNTRAVARTSIALFSKRGCMRKGLYDLRLFFNEDCEEYFSSPKNQDHQQPPVAMATGSQANQSSISTEITLDDVNLVHRKHRNRELMIPEAELIPKLEKHLNLSKASQSSHCPYHNGNFDVDSLEFTSTTQYLQENLGHYPVGTCDKSKKIQQLNKLKKIYDNNQMPKLDWLDRLSFSQIERTMVRDKSLSTHVFLTVEFPKILFEGLEYTAIYFEDKDDQCCQFDIIEKDIVTIPDPEMNLPNLVETKHHALARSARSGISLRDLKPNAAIRNQLNAIVNYPSTHQLSSEEQDLIWKFRFYLRNQKKALAKFLKTVNWASASEASQAIDLMNEWAPMDIEDALELLSPHFQHSDVRKYAVGRLKEAADEELLLYLLQLVQALKYENFNEIRKSFEAEIIEYQSRQSTKESAHRKLTTESNETLPESMRIFASAPTTAPADVVDSPTKATTGKPKRRSPVVGDTEDDLATFLLDRACANDELANYFFWYLCVECEGAKSIGSSPYFSEKLPPSTTASSSAVVANPAGGVMQSTVSSSYLVAPIPPFKESTTAVPAEKSDRKQQKSSILELSGSYSVNNVIDMYLIMMKRFSTRLLCSTPEMAARRHFLLRQQEFVVKLVEIMKEIARENGNRTKKIEKLQSILSAPEPQFRFNFNKNDPLPLPLNPNVKIVGVAAKEATLYKSATMPAKIGFLTTEGTTFYTIFKNGDDLRQDDLVLQMISLMDKLLRKENLDLKLTPYRVLACSCKNGFVQFIDSHSVAEVISSEGSIQNYLRKISMQSSPTMTATSSAHDFQVVSTGQSSSSKHAAAKSSSPALSGQPSGINGISPEIMDAYTKSCAGYCVITYLLGVGDRHLDNLMLTKTGRLFHIDFGFILGRDPKVRPPPMKITREMVDAMGGMDSENYFKFTSLVRTAFLHLRRHANLILNLFSLMVDANVPDIALEPDKTVQKVQDKFKLELDDEQAYHYITEQVDQSVRSIMPVVVDHIHNLTQYLRN